MSRLKTSWIQTPVGRLSIDGWMRRVYVDRQLLYTNRMMQRLIDDRMTLEWRFKIKNRCLETLNLITILWYESPLTRNLSVISLIIDFWARRTIYKLVLLFAIVGPIMCKRFFMSLCFIWKAPHIKVWTNYEISDLKNLESIALFYFFTTRSYWPTTRPLLYTF